MHNLRIRNNQKWGGKKKELIDIREYKKNLARHKVQGEDECAWQWQKLNIQVSLAKCKVFLQNINFEESKNSFICLKW